MVTKTGRAILCVFLVTSNWNSAFAQQPARRESHTFRIAFTIGGGLGGALIGFFTGMSAFDDSINAESKIAMSTALAGAGGAVGGYFLGRVLDKSKKTVMITPYDREQLLRSAARASSLIDSSRVFRGPFGEARPSLNNDAKSPRYAGRVAHRFVIASEQERQIERSPEE